MKVFLFSPNQSSLVISLFLLCGWSPVFPRSQTLYYISGWIFTSAVFYISVYLILLVLWSVFLFGVLWNKLPFSFSAWPLLHITGHSRKCSENCGPRWWTFRRVEMKEEEECKIRIYQHREVFLTSCLPSKWCRVVFLPPHPLHGEGDQPRREGGRLWVQSSCADAKPGSSRCRFGVFALKIRRYLIFVELPTALKRVCRSNFFIFLRNPLYWDLREEWEFIISMGLYIPEGIVGETPQLSKQNNVVDSENTAFVWHPADLRGPRVRVTTPAHQGREFGFQQPWGQLLPRLVRAGTNPCVVSDHFPQDSLAFESFLCRDHSELAC